MLPDDEYFMEILLKIVLKATNKEMFKKSLKIENTIISIAENFFDLLTVKISCIFKSSNDSLL